jgi:hypothetical protein
VDNPYWQDAGPSTRKLGSAALPADLAAYKIGDARDAMSHLWHSPRGYSGQIVISCRDALIEVAIAQDHQGETTERRFRLGPAASIAAWVSDACEVRYRVLARTVHVPGSGESIDPWTGARDALLGGTRPPAPEVSAHLLIGAELHEPQADRTVVGSTDATTELAAIAASGTITYGHAPGLARYATISALYAVRPALYDCTGTTKIWEIAAADAATSWKIEVGSELQLRITNTDPNFASPFAIRWSSADG